MYQWSLLPDWFLQITVFITGLIFGSFLNVVAYRVPNRQSIVSPGSRCPNCHRALHPLELIPIVSWLFLGGRCRTCKAPISVQYPLIELVTAVLAVLTLHLTEQWPARLAWFVFWMLLVAVVGTDLRVRRVPDILSKPGFAVILLLSIICKVQIWSTAVVGAFVCYGVLMVIHFLSRGNMGRGDAKLYLSIGAMLGPWLGLETLMFASFAGSIIGVLMRVTGLMKRREYMPFVPYIAIGVVIVTCYGHLWNHWYLQGMLRQ